MKIVISEFRKDTIDIIRQTENINFLFSYFYARDNQGQKTMDIISDRNSRVFNWLYIDSGVFTARKKSIEIKINDLIDFYKKYQDKVDFVFNLDVGDWNNQLNNAKIMKSNGVPVIPIYHADMPLEYIERFAEINPYIAVSYFKMNKIQKKSDAIMANLDRIYGYLYKKNLINDIPVHLLGMEALNILKRYPAFSIDASSATSEYSYGRVAKITNFKRQLFAIEKQDELKQAINNGIYQGVLMKRYYQAKGTQKRIIHAALLRTQLQEEITSLWKNRGIVWNLSSVYKKTH